MSNVIHLNKVREARDYAPPKVPHHADVLSFMKRRKRKEDGGINSWAVEPTGDYCVDRQTGHGLAEEYLSFIGRHPTYGNGILLGEIIDSMVLATIQRGQSRSWRQISGLELGFLSEINRYAMAAAHILYERSEGRR